MPKFSPATEGEFSGSRNPSVELYIFTTCAVGLALYGYPSGAAVVSLGSNRQFVRDFNLQGDIDALGSLAACNSLGALIGSFLALIPIRGVPSADVYGRIALMRFGAGCYFVGGTLAALTPGAVSATTAVDGAVRDSWGFSSTFGVLWFGSCRVIYGVGMALCYQATAAYVAEVSSRSARGFYLPMIAVMTAVGEFVGNFIGLALEPASGSWRMMAALPAPFAAAYAWNISTCPDSPRWLALRAANARRINRRDAGRGHGSGHGHASSTWDASELDLKKARTALTILKSASPKASFNVVDACFRGQRSGMASVLANPEVPDEATREEIERELDDIVNVIKSSADAGRRDACSTLNQTGTRRAMYVAFGLGIMSMLSGAPAMTYFTKHIFEMTGHSPIRATSMTTGLAFLRLLVTVFVALTAEYFGRRKMLLIGTSVQLAATTMLAFVFDGLTWVDDAQQAMSFQTLSGSLATAADFAIFANAVGFHLGFWALAWTVANELSPLRTRSTIIALNAIFSWILSIITVRFTPSMMRSPGIGPTFGFCASSLFITVVFVYLYVPETKGRTLEDVENIVANASNLRDVVRQMRVVAPNDESLRKHTEKSPLIVNP